MNLTSSINILIPLVVFGYAAWLVIRTVRNRKKGKCSLGGCAGCPLEGGCKVAARMQKSGETKENEGNGSRPFRREDSNE